MTWPAERLGSVALVGNPRFTPMPGTARCKQRGQHCDVGMPPGAQIVLLGAAGACWAAKLPHSAAVIFAVALRVGAMCTVIERLPMIKSPPHFENCRFRVLQCVGLISVCAAIYSTLPTAVQKKSGHEGYKHNLVTMESSMASCIASTYGYSVAGGIPGGLLGEYVMSWVGKQLVAELLLLVGGTTGDGWLQALVRACVSFTLFTVMGAYMEWVVVVGYAFAQRADAADANADAVTTDAPQQNVLGQRDPATDQALASPRDPACIVSLPSGMDSAVSLSGRTSRMAPGRDRRQHDERQIKAVSRSPSPAAAVRARR